MATMKAMQISHPGNDFELVEREIPVPLARQVRIKVEACGVCHSDVAIKEGIFPWLQYPRIPLFCILPVIGVQDNSRCISQKLANPPAPCSFTR